MKGAGVVGEPGRRKHWSERLQGASEARSEPRDPSTPGAFEATVSCWNIVEADWLKAPEPNDSGAPEDSLRSPLDVRKALLCSFPPVQMPG